MEKIISNEEIKRMSDVEFAKYIENLSIFERVKIYFDVDSNGVWKENENFHKWARGLDEIRKQEKKDRYEDMDDGVNEIPVINLPL